MNANSTGKLDKIGELWAELQKTEERLRTVGGGVAGPALDCFVNEQPKDPFDATVFTALSDADLHARIGAAQPSVAAMVAAVVADIDGKPNAQLSPLFARGRAQLTPMAAVEGPHSQWTAGVRPAAAKEPERAPVYHHPAPEPVQERAVRKSRRLESSSDALSAGGFTPGAHAASRIPAPPKSARKGGLASSSDALSASIDDDYRPAKMGPDLNGDTFENPMVPEPRAHRDLPSSVRAETKDKTKPIRPKRPLWLRILWG